MEKFIWQPRIKRELEIYLEEIKLNGKNLNLLFRAASGYGKTTAGFICISYLGARESEYIIPEDGIIKPINLEKRFHFIDEIHTLESPEFLYPIMDSGNHTFIFATNESGTLKEPLRNRCIHLIFSRYTREELNLVVQNFLRRYNLTDEMIEIISSRVKGNPRIAKIICIRLDLIFSKFGCPRNNNELINILEHILYIKENGITEFDEIYLNFLSSCGGLAGLSTIINATHLDRDTILNEVEPNLIELNKIHITSRGRKLL